VSVPAADGPIVISTDGVSKAYGQRQAVTGTSISLRGGEVTVLMGRNGCGKTTLLKLLARIIRPDSGRVFGETPVAYIPQDADTLLFASTVAEELLGVDPDVAGSFAPWLDRYPRDLSTGQRQQLAIAVAAGRAVLLLLDEPTRGLDPSVKQALTSFCLLYTSPSPRDLSTSRMPSSA